MDEKVSQGSGSSRWPESIAVILSIVALLVSGYALVAAKQRHQDERTTELLDQMYKDYDRLALVDRWEVSHLAEAPETYEQTRDVLRAHAVSPPAEEQLRLYMLERTTAIQIFTAFELRLKQWWAAAIVVGDLGRKSLLDEEMDFYADIYLRNPRLLWFWSDKGGRIVQTMDPPAVEFYNGPVLGNTDLLVTQTPDPDGILPDFSVD